MDRYPLKILMVSFVISSLELKRFRVRDVQPCPLGTVYVLFNSVHDRDALIYSSPHRFEDVEIRFVKHTEGLDWKGANFNRDWKVGHRVLWV